MINKTSLKMLFRAKPRLKLNLNSKRSILEQSMQISVPYILFHSAALHFCNLIQFLFCASSFNFNASSFHFGQVHSLLCKFIPFSASSFRFVQVPTILCKFSSPLDNPKALPRHAFGHLSWL